MSDSSVPVAERSITDRILVLEIRFAEQRIQTTATLESISAELHQVRGKLDDLQRRIFALAGIASATGGVVGPLLQTWFAS